MHNKSRKGTVDYRSSVALEEPASKRMCAWSCEIGHPDAFWTPGCKRKDLQIRCLEDIRDLIVPEQVFHAFGVGPLCVRLPLHNPGAKSTPEDKIRWPQHYATNDMPPWTHRTATPQLPTSCLGQRGRFTSLHPVI